jgi:hypothetical protein
VLHSEQNDRVTEQRCDRIPPFELTFTRVTNHHFAFLAFHAQSAPDNGLMDYLHLLRLEHANPLQFLVGEVRLFLVAGAL